VKWADIHVEQIVSDPFGENTYIVYRDGRSDCLVIDPGLEPGAVLQRLDELGRSLPAILNTHGHVDHIAGNGPLKERYPDSQLLIGEGDAAMLTDAVLNLSQPYGFTHVSPAADRTLTDGESFSAAGLGFRVLAIPGHTPGEVVLICESHNPCLAFVGDIIMAGSIGRTDFPGGNFDQLISGIRAKLFALPDDTVLLSGHGPETTVGREKRYNPFVGQRA
jgi:hydroxyacylglutathione hydrolase